AIAVSEIFVFEFFAPPMFKGAVRFRSQLPLFLLVYRSTPTIDGEPKKRPKMQEFRRKRGDHSIETDKNIFSWK
ncbi:MAG: hypothetical protein VB062_10315, partial [Christensenella sp.]|nr:hypothetical protein [Christensenella sp.]